MKFNNFETSKNIFIVAEISANHGRDIEIAKKTILAAKNSGADAIKIQTYTPDTITINCDNEFFKLNSGTIWDGRTLYDLYKEAYTPWEWHKELQSYANDLGLIFFSTPFDFTAVDFLEDLNVPLYKIASFELLDLPLIEYVASKGKPIILSTGIADLNDIFSAVKTCRKVGNNQIILLKCTSSYPAKIEDANLATIKNMKETFGTEVGLSDHTLGITVPVLSIALGARVIEKHIILDRKIGGPDALFSLEPDEFKQMVLAIRQAEKAIGKVDYSIDETKRNNRKISRSLFIVKDIKQGEKITKENLRSIRPGYGMSPKYYNKVIGMKAKRDIKRGTPLQWDLLT